MPGDTWRGCSSFQFYIKPQLQPMTCIPESGCSSFQFYIKPQLVCGVASVCIGCSSFQFYIKPQRNQLNSYPLTSCSSFQFYIKPQLSSYQNGYKYVVPHSNSTSNHNDYEHYDYPEGLFLIPILHQTTTIFIPERI